MQGGVSLALPLPAAVAGADALQHAAAAVRLGPGVSDAVRREGVLVVAAIWERTQTENKVRCNIVCVCVRVSVL